MEVMPNALGRLMPEDDRAAFAVHLDTERGMDEGDRPALLVVDMTKAFADERIRSAGKRSRRRPRQTATARSLP
jgi:hypothetical protein